MTPDRFWRTDAQFSNIAPYLPTDTRGKARGNDRRRKGASLGQRWQRVKKN